MVDFAKLRKEKATPKPIDPIELFRRLLPRATQISDLWNSQAEALKEWNRRRSDKDIVIKLNTGGGKTLVGLIIAQSIINETNGPVLYLCPTNQLKNQTYDLSKKYGFSAHTYGSRSDLNEEFLSGRSILIATYSALFNGQSTFGTTEQGKEHVRVEGILLDDAHTAFSDIRNRFTLSIDRKDNKSLYIELSNLFRDDFRKAGKIGIFDDILSQSESVVLEVPYWSWKLRAHEIRERISSFCYEKYPFIWPLIRDEFDYCHALIDYRSFSITPLYPLIGKFPTFTDCPRRIYMSATLADDSSIIRTFNANFKSISMPIIPSSLTGVGERMILAPALTHLKSEKINEAIKRIIASVSKEAGVLIIVPSKGYFKFWEDIAKPARDSKEVEEFIGELKNGKFMGPCVLANRYDGLDLPGDSCRLLIIHELPLGENIYDVYRRFTLGDSQIANTSLAQKIEQGMGRGTRGSGDYCVVILLGNTLTQWISKSSNSKQLTFGTQAQLKMGLDISRDVESIEDFEDTINKCLQRDASWMDYHADGLAEIPKPSDPDIYNLELAANEQKFFQYLRENDYSKAIDIFGGYLWKSPELDKDYRGWLFQLTARAFYYWGNEEKANELQKKAYQLNNSLLKPLIEIPYVPLYTPGEQSLAIIEPIKEYSERRGYLSRFDEIVSFLTPRATSNQFEDSLKKLGDILGFSTERPEKDYDVGPDVLWIFNDKKGFIIEAKSNKKADNVLTKDEFGQLLTSHEWFKSKYSEIQGFRVVIHPNDLASTSISPTDTYALTLWNLSEIISNTRILLDSLCSSSLPPEKLASLCEKKIAELYLTPDKIFRNFLTPFRNDHTPN